MKLGKPNRDLLDKIELEEISENDKVAINGEQYNLITFEANGRILIDTEALRQEGFTEIVPDQEDADFKLVNANEEEEE